MGFKLFATLFTMQKLTFSVMECNEIQKSNDEFLLSFCRRLIMWCLKMGCHIKREIEESGINKVEILIVEEPN